MAYSEKLAGRIREALADVANVEEKKMFRGIAFMVNDKMCVTVGDNEIMCRVDPALHEMLITKNGCSTVMMRNREYKGWIHVSEEGIQSKKDFDYYMKLALEFNVKAKRSKRGKK
jgi:TfoX/Sxy family transcriptional regulator of competence genes